MFPFVQNEEMKRQQTKNRRPSLVDNHFRYHSHIRFLRVKMQVDSESLAIALMLKKAHRSNPICLLSFISRVVHPFGPKNLDSDVTSFDFAANVLETTNPIQRSAIVWITII